MCNLILSTGVQWDMSTKDDTFYITKTLQGETSAFSTLVDRYKDLVFTLAVRMVKNREEAEEVAQDAFLKAFRSLAKFKGNSKFSTWIYKIAYNTGLDYLKKHRRMVSTVAIDDYTQQEVKTIDNALSLMEKQEYRESIKAGIAKLPADEGAVITLFYFEDLPVAEIALIVNLSQSNVKVKLHRSRKKLVQILGTQLLKRNYER